MKLKLLLTDDYLRYIIAVLTNQGRLSLKTDSKSIKQDQRSLTVFKSKVNAILSHCSFPVILLAATERDKYRKPRMGMWNELLEDVDLDIDDGPDLEASFFVGDAGGRPATSTVKADHSCSDRDLATNVGIEFKTPEEFFLNEELQPYSRVFDPRDFLDQLVEGVVAPITKANPLDIVTLCGSPAAGKSTFFWATLKPLGYGRVNQDILKSVCSVSFRSIDNTTSHALYCRRRLDAFMARPYASSQAV